MIVLSVEGEHIPVLSNEVIVYNQLKLSLLVNVILTSCLLLSKHHVIRSIIVFATTSRSIFKLLIVFPSRIYCHSIPLSLQASTVAVQVFLQFPIVLIDELS